jgi:transcriptional regulator with XRE-family HTH domain
MNYQTVLRIEQGEFATPGPDKLKALARALQLDLTDVWSMAGYAFDTDLPAPLPYLRAKYRDLPAKELRALSRDVARVLAEHGIDGTSRPAPGEDEA